MVNRRGQTISEFVVVMAALTALGYFMWFTMSGSDLIVQQEAVENIAKD